MKDNIYVDDLPTYFNPIDSNLIDDDIKKMFENTSYSGQEMINMQLIKTMKSLVEAIKDMPDFNFDSEGSLYVTKRMV